MKKFFTKLYILNFAIFITNCNLLYSQTPTGLTAVPSSIVSNVPEASSYGIVYELDIPSSNANYGTNAISYALDNTSASTTNHTRVAYYMELDGDWVWVSMDDFASGNLTSLGIPKGSTNNVIWDQTVSNMNIYSNVYNDFGDIYNKEKCHFNPEMILGRHLKINKFDINSINSAYPNPAKSNINVDEPVKGIYLYNKFDTPIIIDGKLEGNKLTLIEKKQLKGKYYHINL